MTYTYEADIERVDGDWLVTFPQFDGTFGGGKTVRKACENAAEALRLRIASMVDGGDPLPRPRFGNPPKAVFSVDVDESYIEATKTVSATEAAEMLGVSKGRVSTLVKEGKLDTVLVDGRSRVTIASVNARLANPPAPHRPKANG